MINRQADAKDGIEVTSEMLDAAFETFLELEDQRWPEVIDRQERLISSIYRSMLSASPSLRPLRRKTR